MDDTKGLSYFFLGLGIGVAAGIIFAPQSGVATRGQIRSKAAEGGDYVRRRSSELKDTAVSLADRGREVVNRQKETIASAVDAGRQAYQDAVGQAKGAVAEAAKKVEDSVQGA
jgi:gas vesicle protein